MSSLTVLHRGFRSKLISVVLAALVMAVAGAFVQSSDGGTRTVYLVRHGMYDYQDDRDPEVGKALIPLGVAQARLVAARLNTLPVNMTALHSSTMTRARETAMVMAPDFPHLQVQQTRLLRECTPATWRQDIMLDEDPADIRACEEQLDKAFAAFFKPAAAGDEHDILVCHGNVIRYFVTKVLRVDPLAWLGMSIGNCSITAVRVNADGTMKLLMFSDVGHLPPNLQTGFDRSSKNLIVPTE